MASRPETAMADEHHHPEEDSVFAEANAWFFRLQAEDSTDVDQQDFARWLAANPQHAAAWAEVQSLLSALDAPGRVVYDKLRANGEYPFTRVTRAAEGAVWADVRHMVWRPPLVRRPVLFLAILFMAVATLQAPVYYQRLIADYATATGERNAVVLADGSRVELNTDTAIRIDFTNDRRRVEVLRGEAYFVVKPDPVRPFVVMQSQGEARVVGTQFSVLGQADRTVVRVAEGRVDVVANTATGTSLRLRAGQTVDYGAAGLSAVRTTDPLAAFAWRRGQVVFQQQPLAEVLEELDRYWPGWIVILDAEIADQRVSGVFEIDRRASVLDALQRRLGIRTTMLSPYLVLVH